VLLGASLSSPDEPAFFRGVVHLTSVLGALQVTVLKAGAAAMVRKPAVSRQRQSELRADFARNNADDVKGALQAYMRWLSRDDDPARRLCATRLPVWVVHAEEGDGGLTRHERSVLERRSMALREPVNRRRAPPYPRAGCGRSLFVRDNQVGRIAMPRRISVVGASAAAALTCLVLAGVASADVSTFSGTVPNGGCDGVHAVTVSGPSRIEAQVASTKSADPVLVYAQILSPNGDVVAQNRYDTSGGGTFLVQVCSYFDQISPPSLPFTARYATGPAGRPALPQTQGGVAGVTTTLPPRHVVNGKGAVKTLHGLAWFTVAKSANGLGVVKVYDPKHHKRYLFTRALIRFTPTGVRLVQGSMVLTIQGGAGLTAAQIRSGERITFHSPKFATSGKVVRGSYLIV
jgi:hypothetical protein